MVLFIIQLICHKGVTSTTMNKKARSYKIWIVHACDDGIILTFWLLSADLGLQLGLLLEPVVTSSIWTSSGILDKQLIEPGTPQLSVLNMVRILAELFFFFNNVTLVHHTYNWSRSHFHPLLIVDTELFITLRKDMKSKT